MFGFDFLDKWDCLTVWSDYGLNGRLNTSKLVLDDYMEFDHVQYIIQRGGSVVLVPYALKVLVATVLGFDSSFLRHSGIWGAAADEAVLNKVLKKSKNPTL